MYIFIYTYKLNWLRDVIIIVLVYDYFKCPPKRVLKVRINAHFPLESSAFIVRAAAITNTFLYFLVL